MTALPEKALLALAGLIACATLSALLLPVFPPLQDFTEWLYQGRIAADLLRGIAVPGFALAHYPIPNSASQLALSFLSLLLPSVWAGRVFLAAYLGAACLVAWLLARRFHPALAGTVTLLLLISLFLNSPFWNGYANSAVGMLIFACYLLLDEEQARKPWVVMLFALATFFAHAVAYCALVAVIGCRMLARRRLDGVILGLAPSLLLALWYLWAKPHVPAHSVGLSSGALRFLAYKIYTAAKIGPYHNFVFASGGDAAVRPLVYWTGVAVNAVYAAGMALMLVLASHRQKLRPELAAACVLTLLFLVMPDVVAEVINPGERFFYPALMLALLYLPLPVRLSRALALLGGMMLVSIAGLFGTGADWQSRVNDDAIARSPARVLFIHRPTSNVEKIAELERAAAEHRPVRLGLTFTSSFVIAAP